MQIYAKLFTDGTVESISAEPKDFYREYACSDSDIFSYYNFFRINENYELVLDASRYKKLSENEYTYMETNGFHFIQKETIADLNSSTVYIEPFDMQLLEDINWYDISGNQLVLNQKRKDNGLKIQRIDQLRMLLSDEDYKILKCIEASMLDRPLPYDLETLVVQRDAYREEINMLEMNIVSFDDPSLIQ